MSKLPHPVFTISSHDLPKLLRSPRSSTDTECAAPGFQPDETFPRAAAAASIRVIIAMKTSRFSRCHRHPRNTLGRDFIVGDLHGHRFLFERELDRVGFNPNRDRVFSVGDLIDRGPESLATLALIEEPWFFAVLGNHELALLSKLKHLDTRGSSRRQACARGDDWIHEALATDHKAFRRLTDRIATLPVALHVDGDVSFSVTHGDLVPIGSTADGLFSDKTICIRKAEAIASSRCNVTAALKSELVGLQFAQRSIHISPAPFGQLPMTYVGHTPTQHVTVHNSYVHIDQGACEQRSKRTLETAPTLLDHREFAHWLDGVATARRRTAFAAVHRPRAADVSSDSLAMA